MMDVLLTYDVDTTTPAGRSRLRGMAKLCEGYGTRVQKSVSDEMGLLTLTARAQDLIDPDTDSIRI